MEMIRGPSSWKQRRMCIDVSTFEVVDLKHFPVSLSSVWKFKKDNLYNECLFENVLLKLNLKSWYDNILNKQKMT